jgi:Asp-tRNA(Asn)/Glu-tRNA(Gln) amidotransferase A subunit family amidase
MRRRWRYSTWTVFFEDAKEAARKLDAEFAETGRLKGLLHGVPISVKDQCASVSLS